jgi:hypothetical protein
MDERFAKQLEINKFLIKNDKSNKVRSEKNTRNGILDLAKRQGCFQEAKQILDKYDFLLSSCSNEIERKHIALNGISEIHRLLNVQGELLVDGVEILPAIGEVKEFVV